LKCCKWLIQGDPRSPTTGPMSPGYKEKPATKEWELMAKNLLKGELKRRGVTYGQLAERLSQLGLQETERNISNKISRGGFTAAFLLQCLSAIGAESITLLPR
jgi:hypothetical protein